MQWFCHAARCGLQRCLRPAEKGAVMVVEIAMVGDDTRRVLAAERVPQELGNAIDESRAAHCMAQRCLAPVVM